MAGDRVGENGQGRVGETARVAVGVERQGVDLGRDRGDGAGEDGPTADDVPALVAAWKLTGDRRYANHAAKHLKAWFINEQTKMNPNLQYAQAIHGRFTGRGIGIIDTTHLVELAQAIEVLKDSGSLNMTELGGLIE